MFKGPQLKNDVVGGEADVERTAEEQGELPHRIQTQLHRRLPAGKLARRRENLEMLF